MIELEHLAARWLAEAETLDRYRDERGATMCRMHAAELSAAVANHETEILTLAQGAVEGGYTSEHLRKLVSEGTIPNAGRKGSPRIRRGDLPVKPGRTHGTAPGFDPKAVAEEIAGRIGRVA